MSRLTTREPSRSGPPTNTGLFGAFSTSETPVTSPTNNNVFTRRNKGKGRDETDYNNLNVLKELF